MINTGMFTSSTDLWATPQDFFDELDTEFGFTLDACALPENAKCDQYYTPDQDGLSQPWSGTVWCNPPYGRQVARWVEKASHSAEAGATVVMLLPARTDTRWFHQYIYGHAETRFVAGRIKFGGAKYGAPFPNMVVVFRPCTRRDENGGAEVKVALDTEEGTKND
ncbi:DNA N-6-adenine-methyltransferase [Intestinibacillus massiliensis]|uniref:DNA N-6-adenine-methyltransferase n=1 Tax=Intestinibacillus massiliensis TaxID=1871029 RepID=UPI000B356992|nr:DNA N-6-adenine-methyltransferase [Intestinibacillus massiliensis]